MKPVLKFGTFEVDLAAGELYRNGRLVRLQQQPFEVLRALVEQPGEVVTREALRRRLWPDGVVVDYDQSLNKSVTKLRDALGDTAANPRFVQTLPKRGYRFLAPVVLPSAAVELDRVPPQPIAATAARDAAPPLQPRASRDGGRVAVGVTLVLLMVVGEPSHSRVATRLAMDPSGMRDESLAGTPIVAARDAYERGRLALARGTQSSVRQSVELFTRAVTFSPRYAQAHAELAVAWSTLGADFAAEPGDVWSRAREAAVLALAIDPLLSGAHTALGRVALVNDRDWPTAEWHFRRAIALDPGSATARASYASALSAIGRHAEAEAEAYRAVAADPLSLVTNTALGTILYRARRFEEAMASVRRALDIEPEFVPAQRALGLIQLQLQQPEEASKALAAVARTKRECPAALAELAHARAKAGEAAEARRLIADAISRARGEYGARASLAFGYLGIGRMDEALSWLERAREAEPATLVSAATDPMWDELRAHPRFAALLEDVRHR
jgi:DNA-binding winged helix-turn-helix (wHTH) protein/tetratricopeptide (TPR) repeat protein